MAGKSKARKNGINPATGLPWRFRAPCETRVVSCSRQRTGHRIAKRDVPQIRLKGAWLERIGFVRGARFLVLVDAPGQIVLAVTSA
jgi:hypothetical protein